MPATMPATKPENATFRGACITSYRDGWDSIPAGLQFIAWGDEICPKTQRPHKQAFAYANKAIRLSGWKKIFPGDHIEKMRGTFQENEAYCSKESSYHKFGTPPMANGLQRSMELVKSRCDDIKPGESVYSIAEDPELFQTVSRCHNFLSGYIDHIRGKRARVDFTPPEVIYIWGPPGTGKTHYVFENEPGLFNVPEPHAKWRDGYSMESAVLFNNVESSRIADRNGFLTELDRYPIKCPIKGGFTWWKPQRIYITALQDPDSFASVFQNPREFTRRVTKIIHMTQVYKGPVLDPSTTCNASNQA